MHRNIRVDFYPLVPYNPEQRRILCPARRVGTFTESVIREMTRLCEAHNGINLAQGFPDFAAPAALKEAAIQAIRDEHQPVRHHLGRQVAA